MSDSATFNSSFLFHLLDLLKAAFSYGDILSNFRAISITLGVAQKGLVNLGVTQERLRTLINNGTAPPSRLCTHGEFLPALLPRPAIYKPTTYPSKDSHAYHQPIYDESLRSLMRAPGEVSRSIFDVCFVCLEARRYLSQRHRQFDSLATVNISSVISF